MGYNSRRLQWNSDASCFRCYTGSQKELTIYRRSKPSDGSVPTPTPDPTPDPDPTPTATNRQVFYYSNIAPQYTDTFNTGGGWNTLEDWVDDQVCSDTLYVVIGAYFDKYTDRRGYTDSPAAIFYGGRSDVHRPIMFYYILMRTKKGNSGKPLSQCSSSEIKCAAFVRSHKTPKGTKKHLQCFRLGTVGVSKSF